MCLTSGGASLYGHMFQIACINRGRKERCVELPSRRKMDAKTAARNSNYAPTDISAALSFKFQTGRPILRHEFSTANFPMLEYEVFHYEGPTTSNLHLADVVFMTRKPATCHIIQITVAALPSLSGDQLRKLCKAVPSEVNWIEYTAVIPDVRDFKFELSRTAVDKLIDSAEKCNRTIGFFTVSSTFVSNMYDTTQMRVDLQTADGMSSTKSRYS